MSGDHLPPSAPPDTGDDLSVEALQRENRVLRVELSKLLFRTTGLSSYNLRKDDCSSEQKRAVLSQISTTEQLVGTVSLLRSRLDDVKIKYEKKLSAERDRLASDTQAQLSSAAEHVGQAVNKMEHLERKLTRRDAQILSLQRQLKGMGYSLTGKDMTAALLEDDNSRLHALADTRVRRYDELLKEKCGEVAALLYENEGLWMNIKVLRTRVDLLSEQNNEFRAREARVADAASVPAGSLDPLRTRSIGVSATGMPRLSGRFTNMGDFADDTVETGGSTAPSTLLLPQQEMASAVSTIQSSLLSSLADTQKELHRYKRLYTQLLARSTAEADTESQNAALLRQENDRLYDRLSTVYDSLEASKKELLTHKLSAGVQVKRLRLSHSALLLEVQRLREKCAEPDAASNALLYANASTLVNADREAELARLHLKVAALQGEVQDALARPSQNPPPDARPESVETAAQAETHARLQQRCVELEENARAQVDEAARLTSLLAQRTEELSSLKETIAHLSSERDAGIESLKCSYEEASTRTFALLNSLEEANADLKTQNYALTEKNSALAASLDGLEQRLTGLSSERQEALAKLEAAEAAMQLLRECNNMLTSQMTVAVSLNRHKLEADELGKLVVALKKQIEYYNALLNGYHGDAFPRNDATVLEPQVKEPL